MRIALSRTIVLSACAKSIALAACASTIVLAACAASGAAEPPPPPSTSGGTALAVLEHHAGPRRDGRYVVPELTRAAAAGYRLDAGFAASIAGAIYAQPLFVPASGEAPALLVAASERNVVSAFDPRTGAQVWTRTLGPPAPLDSLPCGNIDPLGVTGTPVVDPASRTLYVDAMILEGGTHHHRVFALALDDGAVRAGWPVDVAAVVPGFDASTQNQRGALALQGGRVYVPFGGHFGDCGTYYGRIVAISTADPRQVSSWRTGARGGGSWGPSGVASDGARVFLATGNTFGASTWAGGEAVVAFTVGQSIGADPVDGFRPSDWRELDDGDVDLGGSGPVLVDLPGATPSALAVALGKDGKIYLLDRNHLGGEGGALQVKQVSSGAIINAAAAATTARGTYVYFRGQGQGCPAGGGDLTAVRLVPGAPPTAQVAWCADAGGRGSPIVTSTDGTAEALVWVVGAEGDGKLHAYDADTGAPVLTTAALPGTVRRFQSPIASDGRIYVATDGAVRAFVR